ncbi:MAG: dihydrolipoyllysine-residue succinyltransferase [Legionellales bacterium]|nr:dihydrolipoyllysine-residue succinyltransferase [Legionellales bacterium]|tara:strand:+ start:459 stop:1646 length:1188 start_codon:yes stop_codon:yes gene_type:complete
MSIEIKVPVLPESVADATIATWHKKPGEPVKQDENLVDIETDKVVLEVVAPADGTLESIIKDAGATVLGEEVIAQFKEGAVAAAAPAASAEAAPAASAPADEEANAGPAARRMMAESSVDPSTVQATGKGGRITTADVKNAQSGTQVVPQNTAVAASIAVTGARTEERVPMTRLRSRIAERLVEAQQTAAILTTFNEINMKPVMDLRKRYKDDFEKRHGIKLGFMSFFTKATIEALKRFPVVNASIDGKDIVYHGYHDIGIAVSSPRGLVVPVIRNAEMLSMAEIEQSITTYGQKAKEGTLGIDEITGGTFTISNGGVFGSLLSTPILNPPQTGILGLHKIQERAVVENGEVVVRPMMYVALSYDHRIIDGAESVRFLATIKELLEDPARLILDV